jgi:hypothetical protein
MTEEEEKKLARLERLVASVNFDNQALHILGFHTGHRGWVQFPNGVSANTHKEFSLEIFMTMAHILDEGVPSLSFRLEGVKQVVPYELRFLEYDRGRSVATKKFYPEPYHPSVSLIDVQKDFGENERDKDNQHRVELALLGFDCQAANHLHSPYDEPVVL